MEGNKSSFFKKLPNPQFKKKGVSRKGKWNNSTRQQSSGDPHSSDTAYRILCQSKRIGSVIGKGGSVVQGLRVETQAKITVGDVAPGSDERVINICSPSNKIPREHKIEDKDDAMKPHCAAQDALLRVHDKIVEEDISGGENSESQVTARLLVSNNTVGCLIGKKGDVIQRLRSETGATVRVLPAENLPACAMNTDELVQISGNPTVVKRALYEVSTLLHLNARKERPPSGTHVPPRGRGLNPPCPPMARMWSERNNFHSAEPWMPEYGDHHSGFRVGGFDDVPAARGGEPPTEFSLKILCSSAKIGGVIGKGGSNVRELQQETGASIHVDNASKESDERVIRVSSFEAPWNPRSRAIDTILELQNRTYEYTEKGLITTRLLVPSSKVGCLLGQGGQVINEMRRRTQADIRVYSKKEKPKCAAEDEELVQISGNFGVAKDALVEIATRLRTRYIRDANHEAEPALLRPVLGFGAEGKIDGGRTPPLRSRSFGISGGYEFLQGGGREYDGPSYPVPPSSTGYPNIRPWESKIPNDGLGPAIETGIGNIGDIDGSRANKLHDDDHYRPMGYNYDYEIRGPANNVNAVHQSYGGPPPPPAPGLKQSPQHGSYYNYYKEQGSYPSINPSQTPYQNLNSPPNPYHSMTPQGSYRY